MTDKPKKITAGRLELERLAETYILTNKANKYHQRIGASWSEFRQLAKEILKDEIEELQNWLDYWRNVANNK